MNGSSPSEDFSTIDFGDARLNKRLRMSVDQMTKRSQESIMGAVKERFSAKGFYRLVGNAKFTLGKLQAAAKTATIARIADHREVLLVQDTIYISMKNHKKTEGLGYSSENVRGFNAHSCIALTPEGLPLGLVSQSHDTRKEPKSNLTEAEKAARPIEEKESFKWIDTLRESIKDMPEGVKVTTICDREGDFYELYAEALELKTDFVIRVVHNRNTNEDDKVIDKIHRATPVGQVTVNIPRDTRSNRPARQATMEVAYCAVTVNRPKSVKSEKAPKSISMNVVRITEVDDIGAVVKDGIEWILATNMQVAGAEDVMKIVEYYVQRWKIERFHFVLKSGCQVEKIQQRSYERIMPVFFIYSVIAMFIMAITFVGRVIPDMPCSVFFDEDEWKILYRIVKKTKLSPEEPYSMADAVMYLGELGSYKRAPSDGPPGLKSIWKGLCRLYEFIELYNSLKT